MRNQAERGAGLRNLPGMRLPVQWRIPRLPVEDRRSALDALMVLPSGASRWRFTVLMFLSSMIAAVGLLQNSVAVVIGAMMIAPLMTPIMGIAACLIMGWGRRLLQGVTLVTVSAVGAIAVGWLFAVALPATGIGLPDQVIERSSPDIRDLLVALGAGTAGAFATVHKKISVALPGVAVAVAVVPPLAAAGVLLGYGQPELARGAALLFVTNLVGIVLMAAIVFLLTGLVPGNRFRTRRRQILAALATAATCALVVAAILTPRFIALSGHAHDLKVATSTIAPLLGPGGTLSRISASGSKVRVEITSPTEPPPVQELAERLSRALGHPVTLQLGWIPVQDPKHDVPALPPLPLSELSPIVEDWLAAQSLILQGLSYRAGTLVVSASGPTAPQSADELTTAIDERFQQRVPVSLSWIRTAAATDPDEGESALDTARATAEEWVSDTPGTAVLSITGSATEVAVTLIGQDEPDVTSLKAALRTALPLATITIQWVSGAMVVVDPPPPAPTPETGSAPTPPR